MALSASAALKVSNAQLYLIDYDNPVATATVQDRSSKHRDKRRTCTQCRNLRRFGIFSSLIFFSAFYVDVDVSCVGGSCIVTSVRNLLRLYEEVQNGNKIQLMRLDQGELHKLFTCEAIQGMVEEEGRISKIISKDIVSIDAARFIDLTINTKN